MTRSLLMSPWLVRMAQQFQQFSVLAALSPFFMDILAKIKHPHPLVYMRGVRASELIAIVDFVYYGEAKVGEENLDPSSFF